MKCYSPIPCELSLVEGISRSGKRYVAVKIVFEGYEKLSFDSQLISMVSASTLRGSYDINYSIKEDKEE